jgi:integrase
VTARDRAALFASLTTGETVAEFANRWMRDFPRPAIATCKTYEVTAAKFVRAYGDRAMDDITPAESARWARAHPNQVGTLKIMYNDALHGPPGKCAASYNPFGRVRVPRRPTRGSQVPPTQAEVHEMADIALEVLRTVPGIMMRAALLMGFYTLCRPGELAALDHEHIDLARGRVSVKATVSQLEGLRPPKGNHVRDAPFPPAAQHAYSELLRHPSLPYVLWTSTGQRVSARSMYAWWRKVRDEWASRQPGRDPRLVYYVATRHAGITHLCEVLGVSSDRAALLAGHRDGGCLIRRLYSHRDTETALRDVVDLWRQAG